MSNGRKSTEPYLLSGHISHENELRGGQFHHENEPRCRIKKRAAKIAALRRSVVEKGQRGELIVVRVRCRHVSINI